MALTLNISPEMETMLRRKATRNGQEITGYLLQLVENDLSTDLSEHAGLEDYAASVAGIQAGMQDFNAGNSISFEDWCSREDTRKEKGQQRQTTQTTEKAA
jgi:hypothetical protein